MKRVLYAASRAEANKPGAPDDLQQLISEVRNGDMGATAQLLLRYHKQVISIAFDVLQDEALAKESARETLKSAVKQLQRGVRTGAFEPWLMWLTRSDALRYTQLERPESISAKQTKLKTADAETPVNANIAHIMNKYAAELGKTPIPMPRAIQNGEVQAHQAHPSNNNDAASFVRGNHEETEKSGEGDATAKRTPKAIRTPRPKNIGLIMVMALLCVILLWVVFGLIAKSMNGSLPDLGYSWFNNNLFPLF